MLKQVIGDSQQGTVYNCFLITVNELNIFQYTESQRDPLRKGVNTILSRSLARELQRVVVR